MNSVFPLDAGPRGTYVCDHSPMHCPYCQAPAFETTPQCPRCGFSLERVGLFYGVMPRLSPGVSDLAGVFRPAISGASTMPLLAFTKPSRKSPSRWSPPSCSPNNR